MGVYRSAWVCLVALAGAVGVGAFVGLWGLGASLFLLLFVATTVACLRLLMTKEGDPPEWGRSAWLGLASGTAVLTATGVVSALGLLGVTVLTLLTICSPWVLTTAARLYRVYRDRPEPLTSRPPAPRRPPAATGPADRAGRAGGVTAVTPSYLLEAAWMARPPASMDDATLCFAWRTSYVALQQPWPLSLRLRVVQRRQEFLDELERRNGPGFSAWLASGPRAAGDPSRYVVRAQRRAGPGDQR